MNAQAKHPAPLPRGAALLRALGRQGWIPFGLRDRLLRRFADPDSLASTPFACPFFGFIYEGDLASYIDWSVYFHGAYERGLLRFLAAAARAAGPQAVFLDIGANVGQHSLFMAAHAARVHAFEPWPAAQEAIRRKIERNGLTNVTLHGVGLSDHGHREAYFAPTLCNRGTGSFLAGHNASNRLLDTLPLVEGDSYLAAQGIDRVDLIKMDVEGYEPRALAGLAATIARCRPVVAFELNPSSGGEVAEGLFGPDWLRFTLGGGPDRYRLEPFAGARDGATAVMIPAEKRGSIPTGG